jgi:hypothetical protein
VVIRDHDRLRDASPDNPATVVHHNKLNMEANFLAVMPTVASYSERKDHGAGRKILHLGAVELNDARGVFELLSLGRFRGLVVPRLRVGTRGSHAGSQFLCYAFSLSFHK